MAGSLKIEFTARGDAGQLQLDPSINAGDIPAAAAVPEKLVCYYASTDFGAPPTSPSTVTISCLAGLF